MPLAVSPHHNLDEFPKGYESIDQKIEVFIDRVEYWQLGVAKSIIDKDIRYRGFALLSLVMNYFEMIAKYSTNPKKLVNGEWKPKTSGEFFREGVGLVFPDIPPEEEYVIDSLYKRVRNGIYHLGLPATGVILSSDFRKPLGWNDQHKLLGINPDKLVEFLIADFKGFSMQLRDPKETELRKRFEARFDADNS